jgi:TolB-like protein
MLVSNLAQWPQLEVVSREALGPVLREQWLQQRGFSSTTHPVSPGRLKGMRYVVQGKIYAQKDVLTVQLQIIDVETGVVVRSVKAQGIESEIPRLEQDLVLQIMRVFDPSLPGKDRTTSVPVEDEWARSFNRQASHEKERDVPLSGPFHSHSVHHIDTFLSLEKFGQQRREAYRLAETIWNEGWSSEIGQPLYQIGHFPNHSIQSVPLMAVPISVFFAPRRLAGIIETVWNAGIDPGVRLDSDGFQITTDEGTGANQLFMEHFQKPRRVFVRALNEQGEILAVFSHWVWRTERAMHKVGPQQVSVPLWPQPFITGLAEFPVEWVQGEGHHVTFDVVVAPVPEEQIIVVLEPEKESEKGENGDSDHVRQEEIFLRTVEMWIRSNWTPPITEGLPFGGYLPGNRRTAVGVVHIQDGKIVQIQFHQVPEEPLFVKSLNELIGDISELCMTCQGTDDEPSPSSPFSTRFRLQMTLVKDIHALRLGSRPR